MFTCRVAIRGAKRATNFEVSNIFRLKSEMSQETASSDDAKGDQWACLLELFHRQKHDMMALPGVSAGPPCFVCSQLAD